jgi:CDP-diacylglycerol--glycerol-3-phosphate 3-phosphatidyltransferase
MNQRPRWTVPNLLSALRIALVPVLLLLAAFGQRDAFVWVLAAAFLSDAIDGPIARLTGQVSRFGASLDSWADVSIYATIALSMAMLWPELLRRESIAIAAVIASIALPALVGLLRFGHFTSYHTLLVRFAVVVTALGLFPMLLGISAVPFRIAAVVAVIAGLEEVLISLLSVRERSDVQGIWVVLRERRKSGQRGN